MRVHLTITFAALLAAVTLASLPGAALAQADTARQAAVTTRTQIAGIRARLQDVVTELAVREYLSENQVDALRGELAEIYRDLEELENALGGVTPVLSPGPVPKPGGGYGTVWERYGSAALRLDPATAEFRGWLGESNIKMDYGNTGQIYVTVTNDGYTARWTIRDAFAGGVKTTIESENDGDIVVNVTDSQGAHQYLIKDGGLGPIYARATGGIPSGGGGVPLPSDGRWYTPYREAVSSGTLRETRAMEWFIQQYQDNAYVSDDLESLGLLLGELDGSSGSGPVAYLSYVSNGRQVQRRIVDPRRNPGSFAEAIEIVYALDQDGDRYIITLAE